MKLNTLLLFFIIFFAGIIIFCKLGTLPKNVAFDEVKFSVLALSLGNGPYIPFSQYADGHTTLYFYIMLFFFKVFGISAMVLRLPAAIFGFCNVLLMYFILKKFFDKKFTFSISLTVILLLVFVTLRWQFNFSRFAFEGTLLLFLELVSLLSAFLAVKRKNTLLFIVSGIFAGLAFNSYQPGRIFFPLPLLYFFLEKVSLKKMVIYFVSFFILTIPLNAYLMDPKQFDKRFDQQFFLRNNQLTVAKKAEFLGRNIVSIGSMFVYKGDPNGRHNFPFKPTLNPVLFSLFVLGLLITLRNWKEKYNFVFLSYFVLSIIPSILTYPWENPNMLRTYTIIPAVIYFMGKTLQYCSMVARKQRIILASILILLTVSSIYELRTYFIYQRQVFDRAFIMSRPFADEVETMKSSEPDFHKVLK